MLSAMGGGMGGGTAGRTLADVPEDGPEEGPEDGPVGEGPGEGPGKGAGWGELPEPILAWCGEALGADPVELLFVSDRMSRVWGVELADGRRVVIKSRDDPTGRLSVILEAQQLLALRRFPCPLPISEPYRLDGYGTVHAEVWLEQGEIDLDDSAAAAERFAELLARQVKLLSDLELAPPLPNPPWVRWDHGGDRLWPAETYADDRLPAEVVPDFVTEVARRVRHRLRDLELIMVLGHADWESQHIRWSVGEAVAVHDWDSLSWLPEAALVGVAAGTFASSGMPRLAPLSSSAAFLRRYQNERRVFSTEEIEVAWAAGLWTAAHNARMDAEYGREPLCLRALEEQYQERLRLARA